MTPNRTAPAYQEYAASMMARFEYRTLTLAQRGLLYSMRLECWVNQCLPESPEILARILGFDTAEIAAEIPYVMAFFVVENGRIFAPDLESYRQRVEGIRERQSEAARGTNAKRKEAKTRAGKGNRDGSGKRDGKRSGDRSVSERSSERSFNPNPSPSPSQGEGGLGGVVGSGVSDFTLTPDWEVER